jgi:hypothetical protein
MSLKRDPIPRTDKSEWKDTYHLDVMVTTILLPPLTNGRHFVKLY